MSNGSAAVPPSYLSSAERARLSSNVIGACLRSAFIEALYDDCGDLLPEAACAPAPKTLPVPAE